MVDAYEVLQVHPRAELEVIRAAFRVLARKYHPDFGGTGARMVTLNEAWAILGEPKRRKAYDLARDASTTDAPAATPPSARRPSRASTDRRTTGRPVMEETPPTPVANEFTAGRNGPSRGQDGTVMDFGRYAGWSLGDLARHDPYYLEWLERTPIGRPMRAEIGELLEPLRAADGAATVTAVKARPKRRLFGR